VAAYQYPVDHKRLQQTTIMDKLDYKKKVASKKLRIIIISYLYCPKEPNYLPNSAAFIAATFAAFRSLAESVSLAWPCPGVTLAPSATDENFETGLTVIRSHGIKLL
jgi:hypothetical protein